MFLEICLPFASVYTWDEIAGPMGSVYSPAELVGCFPGATSWYIPALRALLTLPTALRLGTL